MFEVNVSPDMAMYTLLINQGYDPTYALCEFIDNAIDAHLKNSSNIKTSVSISIKFYSNESKNPKYKNCIIISDDGPGMSKDTLERALKPAKRPSLQGLSEFGIGMKAAAVWFGDEWQLRTKASSEPVAYIAKFNLPDLLEKGKDVITVEEEIEENRGTTISLLQLRKDITQDSYNIISKNLSEIYRRFITGENPKVKIETSYNDQNKVIKFEGKLSQALVAGVHFKKAGKKFENSTKKEWQCAVKYHFKGHLVEGFIYLREQGSYVENPGLVLFRHDRVIVGLTNNRNVPLSLYKTSNKARGFLVYGELNLNDFPVSYTKDRFNFDEKEFTDSLLSNVKGLQELLTQADNLRNDSILTDEMPLSRGRKNDENLVNINTPDNSPPEQTEVDIKPFHQNDEPKETIGGRPIVFEPATNEPPGTDEVAEEKLKKNSEYQIASNPEVVRRLNKCALPKLTQLYNSLCTLSVNVHPALIHVGASVFFESLTRLSGKENFVHFCNPKLESWGFDKEDRKVILKILEDIQNVSNIIKHSREYTRTDANQLILDFDIINPVICKILDGLIDSQAS